MYLAFFREGGRTRFVLRHSFRHESLGWVSEDVMELGTDPEEFVEYVDERVFFIKEQVLDALAAKGIDYEYEELEEIFWPFIDPVIRQRIEDFGGIRGRSARRKRRFSKKELVEMQKDIHPFDRRRMLFLKFLQVNIEAVMGQPLPFLNLLLNKSRDEIEEYFKFMELDLRPWEMKSYLYAVFGLPGRFAPRLTRFIPDAQDQSKMDEFFLEEICRLNGDDSYLDAGARPRSFTGVHPYLKRYLIQYFDYSYKERVDWHGAHRFGHRLIGSHADHSNQDKFYDVMGISREDFRQMSKKEFVRHFRKKAQELHPDKGGDHQAFIALKEAFEILLEEKGGRDER